MKHISKVILLFLFFSQINHAQNTFIEIGFGVGNVIGKKHTLGKAEFHLNILKSLSLGEIGFDFSTGGNFIPGNRKTLEDNIETLSPNDSRFISLSFFYRLLIKKHFFIEPRIGYASLYSFVHTDDTTRINQGNLTTGIGIGAHIDDFTISFRYQHLGNTPNYEGIKNTTIIKSNSEFLGLVLLRISYRINLDTIFGKKKSTP